MSARHRVETPTLEVLSVLVANPEEHADDDGGEGCGVQLDEVTLAQGHDRVEQLIGNGGDRWLEPGDCRREERRLENATVPGVIGVVRRPEHARLLVEDTGTVTVAPQVRLLEHVNDIAESTEHIERWIVVVLAVQRARVAEELVRRGGIELLGACHVGVGVVRCHVVPPWPRYAGEALSETSLSRESVKKDYVGAYAVALRRGADGPPA